MESDQINAYVLRLKANVHYIPIDADLSNARSVTHQIASHAPAKLEKLERMASAARRVAEQFTYPKELRRVAAELCNAWNDPRLVGTAHSVGTARHRHNGAGWNARASA